MVWETDVRSERDEWVPDAQRWIGQIQGVHHGKIDLDPAGEVTGVHVVAGTEREPRLIVQDVESLLKARLGLAVDYKKIGVVQVVNPEAVATAGTAATVSGGVTFHAPGPLAGFDAPKSDPIRPEAPRAEPAPQPAPTVNETPRPETPAADAAPGAAPPIPAVLVAEESAPRIVCDGVGLMSSDLTVRAEVQLRWDDTESRGVCEGPNSSGSDTVLVARAALNALSGLVAESLVLGVGEIRVRNLGGEPVVMAAVELVEGRRSELLFGTCAAGHNRAQAVVYAVLDAVNRRLSLIPAK